MTDSKPGPADGDREQAFREAARKVRALEDAEMRAEHACLTPRQKAALRLTQIRKELSQSGQADGASDRMREAMRNMRRQMGETSSGNSELEKAMKAMESGDLGEAGGPEIAVGAPGGVRLPCA